MYKILSRSVVMQPILRHPRVTAFGKISLPVGQHYGAVELSGCSFQQKRNISAQSWYEDLSQSAIVTFTEESLMNIHNSVGMPWWATIIATTIGLRTMTTLPLAIYSQHILARLANLGPEAKKITRTLKAEALHFKQQSNISEKQANALYKYSLNKRVNELIVRENCHPMKATVTVLAQMPIWISLSVALRNISIKSLYGVYGLESFQNEGILQITNFALPDPTFIMPVCLTFINIFNIELYTLRSSTPARGRTRLFHNGLRLLTVVLCPVAAMAPSGVVVYWLCSALTATAQNLLLMSPRFRRLCKVPQTENESQHPYATMIRNLRLRLSFAKLTKKEE